MFFKEDMTYTNVTDKKILWIFVAIFGFFVTLFSLHLAINIGFGAWYTPFVIGSYCLFGAVTKLFYNNSTLSLLACKPLKWFQLYLFIVLMGFITEVLGRKIGNFWVYPYFDFKDIVIHVWLIGYPLALFSAIESYWCFLYIAKSLSKLSRLNKPTFVPIKISYFVVALSLILIASLIMLYFLEITKLTTISLFSLLIVLPFFFDSIANIFKKPSLLHFNSNIFIRALVIVAPIIGMLHEIPNTYVGEWIYQNVPFTSFELFNVNVLVLTLGWFYLVLMPLSICHLTISEAYLPIPPPSRNGF